jgi:protein-arginine kinase activator protein McsA
VLQVAGVVAEEEEETEEEEDEMLEQMETSTETERPKTQRELLQGKLDEAVKSEDYERAAQIRDEIERLD